MCMYLYSFKGLTSSGYAQINLPLEPQRTYYTTVRGITNNGNVLQTSSDGFTVDHTSPTIDIDRYTLSSILLKYTVE